MNRIHICARSSIAKIPNDVCMVLTLIFELDSVWSFAMGSEEDVGNRAMYSYQVIDCCGRVTAIEFNHQCDIKWTCQVVESP